MPGSSAKATRDFSCSPKAVWDVLVSPDMYGQWYAEPDGFVGAEQMTLGAKIRFIDHKMSYVVTLFEPLSRFTLSSGQQTEDFTLEETEQGCRVSVVSTGATADSQISRRQLEKLEETSRAHLLRSEKGTTTKKIKKDHLLADIISGVLQGYRNPIEHRQNAIEDSQEMSSVMDISEGDVRIHLRGALAALICIVLLFGTLSFTARFERGDVVPSSGLSLMQSDDVNKYNASLIEMGQSQSSLELTLNCMGERLSPTEFYYCSVERTEEDRPVSELYVTYDAYGNTRNVVFIDNTMTNKNYPLPFVNLDEFLNPSMTPIEVETVLEYPMSGFWMDRSGVRTVYFGVFSGDAKTDRNTRAQLVVSLDSAGKETGYGYYMPYDPQNPLAPNTITKNLKYQYSNVDVFVSDRAAYEKIFLMQGGRRIDADIILGIDNVEYTPLVMSSVLCTYRLQNNAADESGYRYVYEITVDREDRITEIVFRNRYLEEKQETLQALDDYELEEGMTLYEVYEQLGILPSCARLDGDSLTLCFGPRINDRENIEAAYALVIVLDITEMTVTDITIRS